MRTSVLCIAYEALLRAIEIDKSNLAKYQQIYKYAYILSDGIFKIVFAEEKSHERLNMTDLKAQHELGFSEGKEAGLAEGKAKGREYAKDLRISRSAQGNA